MGTRLVYTSDQLRPYESMHRILSLVPRLEKLGSLGTRLENTHKHNIIGFYVEAL